MEEDEEIFFITNTPEYNSEPTSRSSKTQPNVSASYIRNWQTEGACAQLYLTKIQINDFREYGNNNNQNSFYRYSPPKFRYKYFGEIIILYLSNNGQILIPLQVLSRIEKGKNWEI